MHTLLVPWLMKQCMAQLSILQLALLASHDAAAAAGKGDCGARRTSGAMYAGVPTVDLGWLSNTDLL